MATQTIEFRAAPSQTVTLRLFAVGSDTQVASASATEATNRKGTYSAAFTDVPAGEYTYIATIGTSPIIPLASGYVTLTLTTATFQVYDAAKAVIVSDKSGYSLATPPPTAAAIASAVGAYDQRTNDGTAGTIGWYFKKLRQANLTVEATVTADVVATTKTFSVNLTTYPTGAFRHAVMTVVEDSVILEQNSPIETFVNNTTYSTIVLEEALTAAPQPGDVIVIAANSHVHSIASIVSGVWSALTSGLNVVGSTGRALARLIGLVEDSSGDRFTAKALEEAPTGGGGDATEAKQDQIISLIQGSEVLTVASPNVRGNLVLTQGDTYDGVAGGNAKATWTVTTDYTSGWSVVLTIRDKDDAVVYTNAGSVDNATTITVPIVTPTVSPFEGCPGVWQGKYDVQLTKNTSKKTIAIGVVYINEDQTRS